MATARHYCADCETHFRGSVEDHAEAYHDGGIFRGLRDGDWRDWQRRRQYREQQFDTEL